MESTAGNILLPLTLVEHPLGKPIMRKAILLTCLVFLPTLTGCAVSDMLFAVFGDHYSGGGTTREEKKYHFDRQVEASQNYGSWNP